MLKRLFMISIIVFMSFFTFNNVVLADTTTNDRDIIVNTSDGNSNSGANNSDNGSGCDSLFGDPNDESSVAHFLQQIFEVFKFLGPLLCIVLSIVEFVKAISSQDKDALMKAGKRTGLRVVLAIILFFVPTLINFLFPLLGWYGTCGIG